MPPKLETISKAEDMQEAVKKAKLKHREAEKRLKDSVPSEYRYDNERPWDSPVVRYQAEEQVGTDNGMQVWVESSTDGKIRLMGAQTLVFRGEIGAVGYRPIFMVNKSGPEHVNEAEAMTLDWTAPEQATEYYQDVIDALKLIDEEIVKAGLGEAVIYPE